MKRIKAACICQTLHFQLKEDLEHSIAVRLVREKVEHYKQALERNLLHSSPVDFGRQCAEYPISCMHISNLNCVS